VPLFARSLLWCQRLSKGDGMGRSALELADANARLTDDSRQFDTGHGLGHSRFHAREVDIYGYGGAEVRCSRCVTQDTDREASPTKILHMKGHGALSRPTDRWRASVNKLAIERKHGFRSR